MPPNSVENLISELGNPDSPPEDDIMLGFKPSKPIQIDNDEQPRQGRFPAKNKEQKELQALANSHALGSRNSDKSFAELRKLMPSNSSVQIRKAREDGSLSFIGEFTHDAIAPYGSMENYLAQVQRPRIGGGMFHCSLRDAASGNTIPAIPIYIEPLEKAPEMTDAVALKLAEMVGARPANERVVEVQVPAAPPNSLENLRQTAAFLDEVKKPAAPTGGGELGLLLEFQQKAFDNSIRQAQENQKILDDQRQQMQSTIAALTSKPSGPDPVVVELANRFGRLEQAVSTPPPMPVQPPPAPGVAEIIAAIGSIITPLFPVVLPLLTPKPDTSGEALRLMMEQTRLAQQAAETQRREDERTRREEEAARREEQRRADDIRREEQRRAEDQRREDEKIRREELREEQRRADEQRREDEKARREEQREEQRRADEKMQTLLTSLSANKPDGFSTKDVFEMERRHNQTLLDFIQNQNSGQSPQDSLVEKMQEFGQLKEVIEMISPPAAERNHSGGGDSTAATVIKALAPMAEGMFKALAPVMAQQMQQRPAPEIRYIQAPATVVAQPNAIVHTQPVVQAAPVVVAPPATTQPSQVSTVAPAVVAPVATAPAETAPPEVVAGFQAIKIAKTPEQRVDSAVTMLMGLISHPDLSAVVLEMATAVAKKDQQGAVERMHGFLMYGVERGWITKQDVLLTLQAFLQNWDANRAKLLEQVPFLNMLTGDPNETFVDLGGPKRGPAKSAAKVAKVEEEVEEDDSEDETDEDSEGDEEPEDDDENDVDRTEA